MKTFARRFGMALLTVCAAVSLEGCGGSGGAPAVVAPAPAPPPPKAVAVAAPAAPVAAPKPAQAESEDAPGPQVPAFVNKFPDQDPANVFLTGTTGEAMTANPAPAFQEEDRFAVSFGQPGFDSTLFEVAAASAGASGSMRPDFQLPEGFSVLAQGGYSTDGYPLRIVSAADQKVMAFVPGGTVRMGTNTGPAETTPEFVVFLNPFFMDVTEVTVAEFERYRQSQRDAKKKVPPPPLNSVQGANYPALGLAWGDASTYARWTKKELPTEAEFEKAARGPDAYPHPWGTGRPVWPRARPVNLITPVGKFPGDVSPYGIYDLAGNAREWTQDWYSPTAHQEGARIAAAKTLTNWTGPKKAVQGSQRVIKGAGPNWEVFYRWSAEMHERKPEVGFRCILRFTPPATPAAG